MRQNAYWGKYRGRVANNVDPLMLGRLMVDVPAVSQGLLNWALPCVPYAGPQVGFWLIPPIGASVWIEFEGGDPDYPIWVGGFWEQGERPSAATGPEVKVIQTPTAALILNDTPGEGGVTIGTRDLAVQVPASMSLDSAGIQLTVGQATLAMSPDAGVAVAFPPTEVSLTDSGIAAQAETISLDAGEDVSILSGGEPWPPSVGQD